MPKYKTAQEYCDNCFQVNKAELCIICTHNPKYPKLFNRWQSYPLTCKFGYTDCVNDPGYIWKIHPEWYAQLYKDTPYFQVGCPQCINAEFYDDEDK